MNAVPVIPAAPEWAAAAGQLARRWQLPYRERCDAALCLKAGARLELCQAGPQAPGPVSVDFVGGAVGHRRRFGGGRGQAIARAVGLKGTESLHIFDATAGLGRDAFVLAGLGCEVTLAERSAAVAALLEDGMERARRDVEVAPIIARMHLLCGDAESLLRQCEGDARPDVVYIDPMYPHRDSSAMVKKEMRLFRLLVGEDLDADKLLDVALAAARRRVVVKRPDYAEPLAGRRATMTIATKNHRFDIYVIKALTS